MEAACPRADIVTASVGDQVARSVLARKRRPISGRWSFDDGALVGIISPSDIARVLEVAQLAHSHTRIA